MKRVMYVATSLSHKRAFETLVERADMTQMVAGPKAQTLGGIVPEDYSDFRIKNIKQYQNKKELQQIVDKFKPDIYVQASLPCAQGIKLPVGCKKVYVSHGLVGNHVKAMIKPGGFNTSVWKGCDLYCGAWDSVFTEWIQHTAKVDKSKILLDAMPQFDIIHDANYFESYKDKVLKKLNLPFTPKRAILFAGFCCKDRIDFNKHNEDYFKTVIELEKIARENDWLIMVKPRHTLSGMLKFLDAKSWGKKYAADYRRVQASKHMHFITTSGHIYRYFFADCIVVNGCTTLEVEACAANKPLVVIRTQIVESDKYDPYISVEVGEAALVGKNFHLKEAIDEAVTNPSAAAQSAVLKEMGITFDGKAHKRIQDKLTEI